VDLSEITKMNGPATVDEYALPEAALLEPEAQKSSSAAPQRLRRIKRPEFYKPFHFILLVYLFFYCSRIQEMIPNAHTGWLLQPILILGMLMTGSVKAILRSDIGRIMLWFTAWVAVCVPFSTWRGGSFSTFMYALQSLGILFFMTAFIRTVDDCYRTILTIALAMAAVGVLSLVIGGGRMGIGGAPAERLGLGTGGNTLADANFLALYLVIGLPLLWFSASIRRGIMRVGLICFMVPVLAAMARTGSRSGLLALAVGGLVFFAFANSRQKAMMIVGGMAFLICALLFLPPRIVERFTTYFQANSEASIGAAESAETRKKLLIRSLELTATHPLFGVGPGEFQDAEAKDAAAHGQRGLWHFSHNSFTELSSECGIPGLVLYAMAFWRAFRGLSPVRDRFPRATVRRAALLVQIAVVMTSVGAFFLSIAYGGIAYGVLGLSAVLQLAAKREYKELNSSLPEAAA
jgi:O-antigen ligase